MMALLRLVPSCVEVVGTNADRPAIRIAATELLDDAERTLPRSADLVAYRDAVERVQRKITRVAA